MPLDDPETAPSEARVLLIGIDRAAQRRIAHLLHDRGYEVRFAASASEGASALRTTGFAFTVVDLSRDGVDAPAALRPLKGQRNDSGPILLFSDPEGPLATLTPAVLGADRIIDGPVTAASLEPAIPALASRSVTPGRSVSGGASAALLRREIALWRSE